MPGARICADELERGGAGKRHIHDGKAVHTCGELSSESVGDHAADVVADDVDGTEVESVEESSDVTGHRGLGEGARFGGGLDAGEVDEDEVVGRGEEWDGAVIRGPVLGPAVEEEEGGTRCVGSAAEIVDGCAGCGKHAGCEVRGNCVRRGMRRT